MPINRSTDSTESPASFATMFSIVATQLWNSTGIQVYSGETVTIRYMSGTWSYDPNVARFDANGDPDIYICADLMEASICWEPMPEKPKGALIARIGDSEPIYIGNQATFQAPTSGILELKMNDSKYAEDLTDNRGSVVVSIAVIK